MSRTKHTPWPRVRDEDRRRRPRTRLTKGPQAGMYDESVHEYTEPNGNLGWEMFLKNFCGYRKSRIRRGRRRTLKVYGRRSDRRRRNREQTED